MTVCKYCECFDERPVYDYVKKTPLGDEELFITIAPNLKLDDSIMNVVARHNNWIYSVGIPINYCPMCGRTLREAWDSMVSPFTEDCSNE